MKFELLPWATLLAASTLVGASPCTSTAAVDIAAASSTSSSDSSDPTSSAGSSSGSNSTAAATTAAPAASGSAGGSLPASSGSTTLAAVSTIAAGESYDGGMMMIDRGVDCTGQAEGGDSDAVFILEAGASLSNVIIGPNQIEGVHCEGGCTLDNVWWSAVCEDAFTIKNQDDGDTTTITGGGAYGAEDKVLQHNGGGTLHVSGFTVSDFGKMYRSCGNCDSMPARHIIVDDVSATNGKDLVGINSNMGDTATINSATVSGVDVICQDFVGVTDGSEPEEAGSGPSDACIYDPANISGDTSDKKKRSVGSKWQWI